jgi:hypothetical protein
MPTTDHDLEKLLAKLLDRVDTLEYIWAHVSLVLSYISRSPTYTGDRELHRLIIPLLLHMQED